MNNMFTLNGQLVKLPCNVVSLGLDMQCHHCVTTSTILSVDAAEDKAIIKSEGIKIRLQIKDLEGFYVNTKENREKLQERCDKEYNDWIATLNKEVDKIERTYGVKQHKFKGLAEGEHYMGDYRTRYD